MRIGQSSDIHPLVEGRDLVIGGVKIEHSKGCAGHSDGDALTHAICEAIIGALGLGDIGTHFPDTDIRYKGIRSILLLEETYKIMDESGYKINNVDSLIMIERPKMFSYKEDMKKNIAEALHCNINDVNIKATRGEKLGFIGREEGIMAQAVVLLVEKNEA